LACIGRQAVVQRARQRQMAAKQAVHFRRRVDAQLRQGQGRGGQQGQTQGQAGEK
jgi:hypothetical protein